MITSTIQKYAYRVPRAYTRTEPGPQFNATECTSNAETQHNHVVYCHQHYITVRSYKNSYLLFNGATCRFQSSTVFKTRVTGLRLPMNKHWTSPQNVKLLHKKKTLFHTGPCGFGFFFFLHKKKPSFKNCMLCLLVLSLINI